MNIQSPHVCFEVLFKRIPRHTKIIFVSTIILGLAVHMHIMTNMLPNHDDVSITWDLLGMGAMLGRWFLFFPQRLTSVYSLPWLARLVALIYLAVANCLIAACLEIRRPVNCILLSFIMVSFPTILFSFPYTLTADVYIFSVLLACLAAYTIKKLRYGFCFCWIFVVLSMAIYQAYFSFCAGLLVLILIIDILKNGLDARNILIKGIKYVASLLTGLGAYLLSLKFLPIELSTYAGINQMGGFSFSELPHRIINAYKYILDFFLKDSYGIHPAYMKIISFKFLFFIMILLSVSLIISIVIIKKQYKNKRAVLLLSLLILLFPLGCNIIVVMSPNFIHFLMIYALALIFAAALSLLEICMEMDFGERAKGFRNYFNVSGWILIFIITLYSINYTILTNQAYVKLDVVNKQGLAYSAILFSRIQTMDSYNTEHTVVLAGTPTPSDSMSMFREVEKIAGITTYFPGMYSYNGYLKNFIGIDQNIQIASKYPPELENVLEDMPLYPEQGSIVIVDDKIIVKLGKSQ